LGWQSFCWHFGYNNLQLYSTNEDSTVPTIFLDNSDSLDFLTGQLAPLGEAIASVKTLLQSFAQDQTHFYNIFDQTFGSTYNATFAETIRTQWASGNFSQVPAIEIWNENTGTVLGAYSSTTDRIYLAQWVIDQGQVDTLASVILEEIGHSVDAQINTSDTPGDEGHLFSELVQGHTLSDQQLASLKAEDDTGWITVNDQNIPVEMAAFTLGNLVVLQAATNANNTTASILELSASTANQSSPVQTLAIPGTGANAIRISGVATSTGYLSHSNDRSLISFTGANSTDTSSNVNTLNPRAVVTLNAAGTVNIATTYTGVSGNQTRSATSLNNSTWFIADQGGIYTNSSTTASPSGNVRGIKAFGGTVYVGQASATTTNIQVNTVSAASGGSITGLPGLANNSSFQDFYLIQSGDHGSFYDVLYTISATSNTVGTIAKYSLLDSNSNGTYGDAGDQWTANGTYTTTFGGFGLAAQDSGNGALLYVTTGQGALTANSVIKITDSAGYNSSLSITTGNNVTLFTTPTGTILKGIDFAPSSSLPTVNLSVSSNAGSEAGQTVITVTVTASSAVSGNQTVNLGVTGTNITAGDYTLSNSTITILNGQTTGSVTFTIVDDALVEGTEVATLTISNPSSGITLGTTTTQNITITDNDTLPTVNLSVSANAGSEAGQTVITVTATASSTVSGDQTVNLGVSGTNITAGDYSLSNSTITILNGQTTGSVTFTIVDDTIFEGSETATLTISDPSSGITLGTTTSQNVTIADNELIISEVHPFGSGNSTYAADWFEVTNKGTNAINITGWKIDDNSDSFASAVALNGVTSIAPGQSVVFIEGDSTTASNFIAAWFGGSAPGGFTIGTYSGSGVSLSNSGDAVNLFDASGNKVTGVTFGAATAGTTFDNASGAATVSTLSVVGVNGAFNSVTGSEIGSPGTTQTILLNEIYVNPPDTDDNREYIEILTPGGATSLNNVWLLEIDGDDSNAGTIDNAVNLSSLSTGTNGLLVLGDNYTTSHPWGSLINAATTLANLNRPVVATLENGSITFALVTNFTGAVGNDLDTNNDGILDSTPWGNVLDSVGWLDGDSGDRVYSSASLTQTAGTPDAATRFLNNTTANATTAWYNGDISGTGISTAYDPSIASTNLPSGAIITPGDANFAPGQAPTLTEATASVFMNLAATGSGSVSGVLNDPTDPAKTLGIDFTIADPDTPIGNLTVTATSSNPAIVTNANLVLSGTGASRNLKITPSAVGFADITVTVSDGSNSANYVINYAVSAASLNPSTTRFLTGTSDASTAIAIDSNYMLVGDDEDQTIRLYDRSNSGLPVASFDFTSVLGLSGSSEVDIEASSRIGNTIYWIGSHSNNSSGDDKPNRERIFSTTISGSGSSTTLTFGGYYQFLEDDMIAWDNANGHGLGAGFLGLGASAANGVLPEQTNGFNIEGFTIAPNGTTGYVSFRAPIEPTTNRTKALIVPVTNFTSILSPSGGTSGSATFGAPIQLDLGGRGIRSIERNGTGEYIIIAGPAGAATGTAPNDFRLYTWTGNAVDAPVLRSTDLTALNTGGSFETIVEVPDNLTSTTILQLLIDNGDTDWYNNSIASKNLSPDNFQKFRSEIVTLGTPVFTLPSGAISLNSPYSQDFNSLINSASTTWVNNSITGWYTARTGSGTTIVANDGSSTSGNLYSYGTGTTSDRALGSIGSGNAAAGSFFWGARFFNDTTSTINTLYVNYVGEQWRNSAAAAQTVDFQYQIGATALTTGTWTDVNSLDFTSPVTGGTAGALNGNASVNRTAISDTVSGLSLAPGQEIWLRWSDPDHTGSDHGLAIDDLQVSTSPLPGVTIVQSGGSTNIAEGGTTDTYDLVLNTQPTATVTITVTPDSQITTSANTFTFTTANWNIPQTVTVTAVDDAVVEGLHNGTISHTAASTDTNYNGISIPSVTASITDNDVAIVITKIHDIQGSGSTAALSGVQTIEGIVVGKFSGSTGLNGFYVQEEDADADADSATSEGIFIYDPSGLFSGVVGDKVSVTGTVGEYTSSASNIVGTGNSSLTQLSSLTSVINLGAATLPSVTNVVLPVADASVLERYEGMLVSISGGNDPLVVTETFKLGRYGQVGLSVGDRLGQYTQFNAPSVSGYADYRANLQDGYIILDDGSTAQNPDPEIFARGGQPLSALNTLRGGDTIASITGVLDERFEGYRIQTTTPQNFQATNPRANQAPNVGGTIRVASANLLNFFNGNGSGLDGASGGFPTSRGANNLTEFNRQLDKTVQEVLGLNADVFGYNEMENDGYGSTSAVQQLVNALNAATAPGTYAFVAPPASALMTANGVNDAFGGDEITVGFIYKTSAVRVAPGTSVAALTTGIFDQSTNRVQRPSLAVTFERLASGNPTNETFTAVINHFKSKGSAANLAGDADQNDGQGFSNATRTQAAQELAAWLATNPTGTTDPDYLIMGDLNAYRLENPITTLTNAGYNSLFDSASYSYQFNGQWGSLDHALANTSLNSQVTGAAKWHINSDEPVVLDYNTEFKSTGQISSFYNVDPFRTSDHDPIVVGLNLNPTNLAPTAVTLSNQVNTIAENTNTTTRIKVADVTITDDGLGTNNLSLTGADATRFEVDATGLYVKAGTVLDYEAQSVYNVTVNVDDASVGSTPDATANFSLTLLDRAVFAINDATITEGDSGTQNLIFTVTTTDPLTTATATVNYATADNTAFAGLYDYTATNGILTFNPGDTSKTISVPIIGDTVSEGTEVFHVNLSGAVNATIADNQGIGTIVDNDPAATLSVSDASVVEGNSGTKSLVFQVLLSAPSGQTVTVNYATADGTATTADNDYTATSGILSFAPGNTALTVAVSVIGDTINEADQTLFLNLSNASGASILDAQGIGTIVNDDAGGSVTITGTSGNDTLIGTSANEILVGLAGNDTLVGLGGNDIFIGGPGADNLRGLAGQDTFVFNAFSDSLLAAFDTITRFSIADGDKIQIGSLPTGLYSVGTIASATSVSDATTQAYAAANSGTGLAANQAVLFKYGTSTYLSVNDGTAAFNAASDLFIKLSLVEGLPAAGALTVGNYFS
jgi:predicted extracellular nuclease